MCGSRVAAVIHTVKRKAGLLLLLAVPNVTASNAGRSKVSRTKNTRGPCEPTLSVSSLALLREKSRTPSGALTSSIFAGNRSMSHCLMMSALRWTSCKISFPSHPLSLIITRVGWNRALPEASCCQSVVALTFRLCASRSRARSAGSLIQPPLTKEPGAGCAIESIVLRSADTLKCGEFNKIREARAVTRATA